MSRKSVSIIFAILGFSSIIVFIRLPAVDCVTWVEGHITEDTTWKIQDSPFVVINDIIVDQSVTLTIQGGVEIKFGGYFSLLVKGNLYANGTEENPIVFTSNKVEPVLGDWNTIEFYGGSLGMEHCEISYAEIGITLYSGEMLEMKDCTIGPNSACGIFSYPGYHRTTVINGTLFTENGGWGSYLYGGGDIALSNCVVSGDNGILISGDGHGMIYDCTVAHNDRIGIQLDIVSNFSVISNCIYSNDIGLQVGRMDSSVANLSISDNVIHSNTRGISVSELITVKDSNFTRNTICHNHYGVFAKRVGNIEIHCNNIYSNVYGAYVDYATLRATNNYWGDSTGPYHESMNPYGEGNPVNGDGVDLRFIPFLTSPVGTINQRPTATLEVDKTNPDVNEVVTFDASGSTDDGRIDYYFFDFGDGTNSSWTPLSVVSHQYSEEGTYDATLVVMDDFGFKSLDGDSVCVEMTVIPEFPSFLIVPLFVIATLLAAMLYRRKHSIPREC